MTVTAKVGLTGLLSVTIRNHSALYHTAAVKSNTEKGSLAVQSFAPVTCLLNSLDTAMVLLCTICYLFSTNKTKPQKPLLKKK